MNFKQLLVPLIIVVLASILFLPMGSTTLALFLVLIAAILFIVWLKGKD